MKKYIILIAAIALSLGAAAQTKSWKKVEDNAVIETETVKKAADTFVDTTLKVNGVGDGKASYNRVVELMLLEYYSEK